MKDFFLLATSYFYAILRVFHKQTESECLRPRDRVRCAQLQLRVTDSRLWKDMVKEGNP